ncbi:MAG: hypothetical protein FWF02_00900 [Micrococcales bacterium]|nr:hypothetical protein [Micrococcales bacterium]MCL2666255.1 hypothetical protein [Micrococcales bacterium]
MGLGINKDLEPLVRQFRKAGGTVEVRKSTHVRWTMPDGTWFQTGLTMNSASELTARRRISSALAEMSPEPTDEDPPWQPTPDGKGKFWLVDAGGNPQLNASGFPRTFSSETAARQAARQT